VVATFKPAVRAGEHDLRHGVPKSVPCLLTAGGGRAIASS